MYGENIPAWFKTSKGSEYSVSKDDVYRKKYDGTIHSGHKKNIFYVGYLLSEALLEHSEKWKKPSISVALGQVVLTYTIPGPIGNSITKYHNLAREPVLHAYPFDIVVGTDGKIPDDDHFHVGDKITHVKIG